MMKSIRVLIALALSAIIIFIMLHSIDNIPIGAAVLSPNKLTFSPHFTTIQDKDTNRWWQSGQRNTTPEINLKEDTKSTHHNDRTNKNERDTVDIKDTTNYHDIWKNTNRSITIVTAFFNLGKFPKGSLSNVRSPDSYKNWMKVYKYLKNPLIIYTDSDEYFKFFTNLRKHFSSTTKIIKFSRETLWAFQIKPNITEIYSKPGYPKHYPNTYVPEYTSMTHSKLTLVSEAIKSNIFPSDYYCWIDLGYFRDISGRKREFYLEVPIDFDSSKVGVTRVYNVDLKTVSAKSIILQNINWIGGGLFLGKPEVLKKFESQYKSIVLYYLSKGLMNVEQHILYSMYTAEGRKTNPISVEVQTYVPGTHHVISGDPWFYLGYLMYSEIPMAPTVSNSTTT